MVTNIAAVTTKVSLVVHDSIVGSSTGVIPFDTNPFTISTIHLQLKPKINITVLSIKLKTYCNLLPFVPVKQPNQVNFEIQKKYSTLLEQLISIF